MCQSLLKSNSGRIWDQEQQKGFLGAEVLVVKNGFIVKRENIPISTEAELDIEACKFPS